MFTQKEDLDKLGAKELLDYFNSLFNQLAARHGYHNTFENFLDCCLNAFCFDYDNDVMDYVRKKYSQEERYIFGEMLQVWIFYMNNRIVSDDMFVDFFGTFYEEQAISKQKGFAQYFTPEPICKFMVSIVNVSEQAQHVYEPACGSGRFNLAMHAENHRLFHVANDLDYTCAKMAALNFMIHGIKGIVTCDDGLFPKRSFRGAFIVNYKQAPCIQFVDNANDAYAFINFVVPSYDKEVPQKAGEPLTKSDTQTIISPSQIGTQLKLF